MKGQTRWAWRRDSGVTLMELLVAIVIAAIFFAVAVPFFAQAIMAGSQDRMRVLALNAAQDRIEKIRQLAYDNVVADKTYQTSTPNLYNPNWANKQFGPTWEVTTSAGDRYLTVDYYVTQHQAVPGKTAAYRQVDVKASWTTYSQTHSVVLSTIVYAQSGGPQINTFLISPINAQDLITSMPVTLTATIDAADLESMLPYTVGTQNYIGKVVFTISAATGGSPSTASLDYNGTGSYTKSWTAPGGLGVADGFYRFSATAYSAAGVQGNTWTVSKRIETGPPPAVTDLKAIGSSTVGGVTVSWTGSPASDLSYYEVDRTLDGVTTVLTTPADLPVGSTAYTDSGAVANADYTYTVKAYDRIPSTSPTPATTTVTWVAPTAPPNPAQSLQGSQPASYLNNVSLSWLAPTDIPGITVNAYHVYAAGAPNHAAIGELVDTVTLTVDNNLTQPWNTTVYYQVKAVSSTLAESSIWASIATTPVQATDMVNGAPWIKVTLGDEPLYTLNVTNNVAAKTTFTLWYRGANGTQAAVEVGSGLYAKKIGDTVTWTGLHAGVASNSYELRWGSNGVSDGSISGAILTVSVTIPTSNSW